MRIERGCIRKVDGETPAAEHSRKQLKERFSLLNALRGMNRKIGLRRHPLIHQSHTVLFLFPLRPGCTNTHRVPAKRRHRQATGIDQQPALFASELEAFLASLFARRTHTGKYIYIFLYAAPLFQRYQELTTPVTVAIGKEWQLYYWSINFPQLCGQGSGMQWHMLCPTRLARWLKSCIICDASKSTFIFVWNKILYFLILFQPSFGQKGWFTCSCFSNERPIS